jgi:putative toxin-antitoxin system antitoxin component (TIGR02293 family)
VFLKQHAEGNIMHSQEIRKKAAYVLGDEAEAQRWLEYPARGLDYRVPVDVMLTENGRQRVYDLLCQIEYCVYI